MAHVVTDNCVKCRFTDCVDVCPVACFYVLDDRLVIHPDDCIDCTACVPECPVEAIFAEDDVPDDQQDAIEFNKSEAERLQSEGQEALTERIDPLETAEERKSELGF